MQGREIKGNLKGLSKNDISSIFYEPKKKEPGRQPRTTQEKPPTPPKKEIKPALAPKNLPNENRPLVPSAPATLPITVVDFDMPFIGMVKFMTKWALASIPAAIILGIAASGIVIIASSLLAFVGGL